jgi:hypothetical protein
MKKVFDEQKVNVRVKIAAMWASFMFLYIYVDYFHLYMPGALQDMLSGRVFKFDISQTFLTIALVSVSIPALMIFLSVGLPAKISRWANIIIATIYIPYTLVNLAGKVWVHMIYGAAVEVLLLLLIARCAWKWPLSQKIK